VIQRPYSVKIALITVPVHAGLLPPYAENHWPVGLPLCVRWWSACGPHSKSAIGKGRSGERVHPGGVATFGFARQIIGMIGTVPRSVAHNSQKALMAVRESSAQGRIG
jgi:hypothetical protein